VKISPLNGFGRVGDDHKAMVKTFGFTWMHLFSQAPMKARPVGASFAATCVGLKKGHLVLLKAVRTERH
jgi:hypothetical protein